MPIHLILQKKKYTSKSVTDFEEKNLCQFLKKYNNTYNTIAYVKAMNFKHRTPFKRETKGTKTIVGQNMLHYKSDIEAHTTFLAHICQNIGNESILKILI